MTGHSSGGWASLWLQISYSDLFGGCWSTAPDPVDFRAFQTLNIYEDRNGHWTREGLPRPVARSRTDVGLTSQGEDEARAAGRLLVEEGLTFDLVFTSLLKRAKR